MDRSYIDELTKMYSRDKLLAFGGFGDMLSTVQGQAAGMGADALLDSAGGAVSGTIGKLAGGLGGAAASGAAGGALGSIAGGPWGMAADAAGMIMSAAAPKRTSNTDIENSGEFDFSANLSNKDAGGFEKRQGIAEAISSVPMVGKLASGMLTLGNSLFTKKATGDSKSADYNAVYQGENAKAKGELYGDAFAGEESYLAACGGYMKAMGGFSDENSEGPAGGDPYTIGVGGTHEENNQNGITVAPGVKAEQDEFMAELSKGQFAFTNKF
jgi:hypothetical protein